MHNLERGGDGRYHCTMCLWSWSGGRSAIKAFCPGVPRYAGWTSLPDELKTFTQLKKAGLKTDAPPAGCIYSQAGRDFIWLYDVRQATARRIASATQREALAKGRATAQANVTCQDCGHVAEGKEERRQIRRDHFCEYCIADRHWREDHNEVIRLARSLLEQDALVLDTETTGLDRDDVVVEVAVLAEDGAVLLDTLVQTTVPIDGEAQALHGIPPAALADAPTFAAIWPQVLNLIGERPLVSYNAAFDCRLLRQTAKRAGLTIPPKWDKNARCLMEMYAAYQGGLQADGSYHWWSLSAACHEEGIVADWHRARADAQAALALLKALAAKEEVPEKMLRQEGSISA